MRIVSWTVVFSAVAALIYTGLKPLAKEFGFPPVDPKKASGAMMAPADRDASDSPAPPVVEAPATPPKPVISAEETVAPGCEESSADTECTPQRSL